MPDTLFSSGIAKLYNQESYENVFKRKPDKPRDEPDI